MTVLQAGGRALAASGVRLGSGLVTPWGYLTPALRDKRLIPFNESTCHALISIGSSATYSPAGITVETIFGYDTFLYSDTTIWQADETAPALNVEYNASGWSGASRCTDDGATLQTVRCPTSFVVPGAAGTYDNNAPAFYTLRGWQLCHNQRRI